MLEVPAVPVPSISEGLLPTLEISKYSRYKQPHQWRRASFPTRNGSEDGLLSGISRLICRSLGSSTLVRVLHVCRPMQYSCRILTLLIDRYLLGDMTSGLLLRKNRPFVLHYQCILSRSKSTILFANLYTYAVSTTRHNS